MTHSHPSQHILIKVLSHGVGLDIPRYETALSAGMDVRAAIDHGITLRSGERTLVPTGFSLELPAGHEAQIRSRSGLALKNGVVVLNAPATIDADYRGEVKVILINHGRESFEIQRGMRIAQIIIASVIRAHLILDHAMALSETGRGSGGFGSTGLY